MNYYVSDEVPKAWDHIIDSFITMVQWNIEFNSGEPVDNLAFTMKRGLLFVTYTDGDSKVDALAHFAREMSANVCHECGLPAVRKVFGSPRCEQCD